LLLTLPAFGLSRQQLDVLLDDADAGLQHFGKRVDDWGQLHHNAAPRFQRQPDGLALLSFHLVAGEREAVKSVHQFRPFVAEGFCFFTGFLCPLAWLASLFRKFIHSAENKPEGRMNVGSF
jgi:hypothetical protein